MNKYTPIIGLETHVQLDTKSKLFCGCDNESFNAQPNVNICPLCSGQPGSLPVINKQALDFAILAGLALNCEIAEVTKWDRKSYFYPDLPKGYQISQFDKPICIGGWVEIVGEEGEEKYQVPSTKYQVGEGEGENGDESKVHKVYKVEGEGEGKTLVAKKIRLVRAHLEEDAGKSIHDRSVEFTFLDYNRCGTPLLEIVSEPDLSSSAEAEAYGRALRRMMRYLGVSRVNMEQGHMRFDVNVNLRVEGENIKYTPIAEVKNLNSFRHLVGAIEYEIKRQIEEFEATGLEKSEGNKKTMLWDDHRGVTMIMRSKEEAADYRYFADPDVMPVRIDREWVEKMQEKLPEMPNERLEKYQNLGMALAVALNIVENKNLADYLDNCLKLIGEVENEKQELINWFGRDVMAYLNQLTESEKQQILVETKLTSEDLVKIVKVVGEKKITRNLGKEWLEKIWLEGAVLSELEKVVGESKLDMDVVVAKVFEENKNMVDQYLAGNEKVFNVLIGKMMKETKGLVEAGEVARILKEKISNFPPNGDQPLW